MGNKIAVLRGSNMNSEIGKALKIISDRLKNTDAYADDRPCKKYGCLECKHF